MDEIGSVVYSRGTMILPFIWVWGKQTQSLIQLSCFMCLLHASKVPQIWIRVSVVSTYGAQTSGWPLTSFINWVEIHCKTVHGLIFWAYAKRCGAEVIVVWLHSCLLDDQLIYSVPKGYRGLFSLTCRLCFIFPILPLLIHTAITDTTATRNYTSITIFGVICNVLKRTATTHTAVK
jgi:hypothetical protein